MLHLDLAHSYHLKLTQFFSTKLKEKQWIFFLKIINLDKIIVLGNGESLYII